MTVGPTVILHTSAPALAMKLLRERHPGLAVHPCESYAGLAASIEETKAEIVYSVRFDGTERFPRSALLQSPAVKWVSVGGSGTDHLGPWAPERVTVTNAAGVAADMMAEYALGRCCPSRSIFEISPSISAHGPGCPAWSSRSKT